MGGLRRDLSLFDEDNARWRNDRKRVPWDERVKLIDEQFPGLRNLDFNALLRDNEIFGRILKDILKLDQIEPGRAGPRPNIDPERGMQAWREWTGQDYSELPFAAAFTVLVGERSVSHVARMTGICRSHVYRLLTSVDRPIAQDMRDIAEAFGKRPAYFSEYRAEYLTAAFAARIADEPELTVSLYLKMVRA